MEPIDWTKPIELMNGEPLRYDCSNKYGIWIQLSAHGIGLLRQPRGKHGRAACGVPQGLCQAASAGV